MILNALVVLVAVLIAYSYIYKKQDNELQGLNVQRDMEIKKNKILDVIGQEEANIFAYKKMLPKKDSGDVINTVGNIAKQFNITVASIKPATEIKTQDFSKFPYDVSLTAPDYNSLGKFMSKLETYSDVFIVELVNITPQGQKGQLNAVLKINSIAITD